MDFGRAFTFPFDDEEWPVKIIIGTLLSFIPFMALGYQAQVVRSVLRGEKRPLPGADELGQIATDGILSTIAAIVYFLPLSLIGCVIVFPAVALEGSDLGGLLLCGVLCCVIPLALLYTIPGSMLWWMGLIRYAESGDAMDFFRFSARIGDVRRHAGDLGKLWLTMVALVVVGMLAMPLAGVIVVGLPLLGFYSQLVSGHLIGQVGRMILIEG